MSSGKNPPLVHTTSIAKNAVYAPQNKLYRLSVAFMRSEIYNGGKGSGTR